MASQPATPRLPISLRPADTPSPPRCQYAASRAITTSALDTTAIRAPKFVIDEAIAERSSIRVPLNEPLMTAAEVAALLAIPRSSVYEYARRRRGGLPSIAVGRHRRFYRSDVEQWLGQLRDAVDSR